MPHNVKVLTFRLRRNNTSAFINNTFQVFGSSLGGHIIMTSSEDKVAKAPKQTMMV